jgi:hypothetical protein
VIEELLHLEVLLGEVLEVSLGEGGLGSDYDLGPVASNGYCTEETSAMKNKSNPRVVTLSLMKSTFIAKDAGFAVHLDAIMSGSTTTKLSTQVIASSN